MKQKDIAMIIVVAAVAALASFFISRSLFASGNNRTQKAAVVDPITTDFSQPDPKYFNSDSIDPTKLIQIGNNNNTNPFNGTDQ